MKRYGFLFGAGAEIAYNLPSGGRFALDIFRQNTTKPKEKFRQMRDKVDPLTSYAAGWLPQGYKNNNISTYGKSVFQSIINSTVEHRRNQIIQNVNEIDKIAEGLDKDGTVKAAFLELIGKDIGNTHLSQIVEYNDNFSKGNKLFESSYFSGLMLAYKQTNEPFLKKIILSIMQLQLGALSEDLVRNISDNLFKKKDDTIDIFDDFGDLIQLNYSSAGVSGLELLLDGYQGETVTPIGVISVFAQSLVEEIYASVLDYKSLIDSNWHYLYNPRSDWAKFCKISIFLLTVREYIVQMGDNADQFNPDGYYNMLRKAINDGLFETTAIATTNYNKMIQDILAKDITYLNGSVSVWYDPYLNKIGSESELDTAEHHIIVPLIFTQSGTKPMTSISMSMKYVDLYRAWKDSDAVVVVGFGFGADDEHINGILRTLVNDDGKELIVVTLSDTNADIARKLKVENKNKIKVIQVDKTGHRNGKNWAEMLVS